jgi:pimeloyl-ACP methyl ester carboxylesterase
MASADVNGVSIEYETYGQPTDPPLLLVMGLGSHLIDWPPGFLAELVARGYLAIIFDNRDAGLSTGFDDAGIPDIPAILGGDPGAAPYLLADMAADAAGLLDALGIESAHVVGVSLGGMIAQQLTIDHPARVRSLTSIMSTTGDPAAAQPTPEAASVLGRPPAADRDQAIANAVATSKIIGSPAFPTADEELQRRTAIKYDRAYRPLGTLRQYAAILASPDRTKPLGGVTVPVAVIHGEADPLVPVGGGRATAAAVPDAELLVIPGMGHDLPPAVWTQVIDAIVANTRRSGDVHQ